MSSVQKLGACNFFGGHWTLDKDPDFAPVPGGVFCYPALNTKTAKKCASDC
jgi:hypothetical protein